MLETVEINPQQTAQSTVIWLHGLGADGHDFANIVPALALPSTRFIFPHAKKRAITVNGGMEMRAWYDIIAFNLSGRDADKAGVADSIAEIEALISQEESRGIAKEQIMIAGFSQGGAIALRLGLQHQSLKGVLALSSYLLFADDIPLAQGDMPIMMMHGRQDEIVPFMLGQQSYLQLKEMHYKVQFRDYAMQHQVCPQQINDIQQFLQSLL